jgi:two-component sensor histidine kinase
VSWALRLGRRGIFRLLRAGTIGLPCVILLIWGWWSWHAELARGEQEALASAEIVRDYALRVLQTQQGALAMAESILAEADQGKLSPREVHERLAALSRLPGAPMSAGYVTQDGILAASSRVHPISEDVSDRAYFRALLDASGDGLRVERHLIPANGKDVLVFARRRRASTFRGILYATVPVEVFTGFLGRIAQQARASASLLRGDGVLLVRESAAAPALRLPSDEAAMQAVAAADRGVYEALANSDGVERIYGFARLDAQPLYAKFGIAVSELRRRWLEGLGPVATLLAISGVLAFATLDRAARAMAAEDARLQADGRLAEARRGAALHEKLLRELHHRVKNSLAMVQALIRLHPGKGGPDLALELRVLALANVHDLLHVTDFTSRLDLPAFLRAIAESQEIDAAGVGVEVTVDADPVEVDIERATPVALIAAELLTNAVRHAFPGGRGGRVLVSLRAPEAPGGMARLSVLDDGVSLPYTPRAGTRRSGLDLVRTLATQIGGRVEWRPGPGGMGSEVSVTLPAAAAERRSSDTLSRIL